MDPADKQKKENPTAQFHAASRNHEHVTSTKDKTKSDVGQLSVRCLDCEWLRKGQDKNSQKSLLKCLDYCSEV